MERELYYKALHRNVLIVYTVTHGQWVAYCVPVPGESHAREQHLWAEEGAKLQEYEARALWPGLVGDFDNDSLTWRR